MQYIFRSTLSLPLFMLVKYRLIGSKQSFCMLSPQHPTPPPIFKSTPSLSLNAVCVQELLITALTSDVVATGQVTITMSHSLCWMQSKQQPTLPLMKTILTTFVIALGHTIAMGLSGLRASVTTFITDYGLSSRGRCMAHSSIPP